MNRHFNPPIRLCVFTLAALLAAAPAAADRPSRSDEKHENKHAEKSKEHQKAEKTHFDEDNRRIINEYYGEKFRNGKCPPGLAKKNNGCLPPGQAKKWSTGQPLPADLKRYDLPKDLVARLPVPPSGHRYVRVASDILLIAVGTGMVVDAIEDIGKQF